MEPDIVVVDKDAAKFAKVSGEVVVYTSGGRYLGRFIPAGPDDPGPYEDLVPPFSEEELDRRMEDRTGRSLDEILRDLEGRS